MGQLQQQRQLSHMDELAKSQPMQRMSMPPLQLLWPALKSLRCTSGYLVPSTRVNVMIISRAIPNYGLSSNYGACVSSSQANRSLETNMTLIAQTKSPNRRFPGRLQHPQRHCLQRSLHQHLRPTCGWKARSHAADYKQQQQQQQRL